MENTRKVFKRIWRTWQIGVICGTQNRLRICGKYLNIFTYWSTLPRALGENSCIAIPTVPCRSLPRINHCITIPHSLHLSILVPHIHFMPFLNLYKLTYLTYEILLKTPGTEGRQLRLSRAPSRTSILRSILISLHLINTYWDPCLRNKILLSPFFLYIM